MLSDKATEKVQAVVIAEAAAHERKSLRDELRTRYAGRLIVAGRLKQLQHELGRDAEGALFHEAETLADADLAAREGE